MKKSLLIPSWRTWQIFLPRAGRKNKVQTVLLGTLAAFPFSAWVLFMSMLWSLMTFKAFPNAVYFAGGLHLHNLSWPDQSGEKCKPFVGLQWEVMRRQRDIHMHMFYMERNNCPVWCQEVSYVLGWEAVCFGSISLCHDDYMRVRVSGATGPPVVIPFP